MYTDCEIVPFPSVEIGVEGLLACCLGGAENFMPKSLTPSPVLTFSFEARSGEKARLITSGGLQLTSTVKYPQLDHLGVYTLLLGSARRGSNPPNMAGSLQL